MSGWFSDFFMTRAIANLFGFKGFERDVFFALNYMNHQKQGKYTRMPKATSVKESSQGSTTPQETVKKEEKYEPDLIIQCTNDTYIQSIRYAANYLTERDNRSKTARIEVYKKVSVEE